jgi:tRNA-dihydrouridine synthase B
MPVLLAPMAGVTDWPFRDLVSKFGAGLVTSEMIASRAVLAAIKNKEVYSRLHCFSPNHAGVPVSVQLVGCEPDIMAVAAEFNEQHGASLIDINVGCPVKRIVNSNSGAALMKNPPLVGRIVRAVVSAVKIPVTVKMRLGWNSQSINVCEVAKTAEAAGASAVTVHGRTRSQLYSGNVDWRAIRAVKSAVSIPVIGNGDVTSVERALEVMKESGVDGVMIGRGALGRPWFLRDIALFLSAQPPMLEINLKNIVSEHMELILENYGETRGVMISRKHLAWYSRGKGGAAEFRAKINVATSSAELFSLISNFFERAS